MADIKKVKIYTTRDRVINGEFIRATADAPVEVTFPEGFDPFGRKVSRKTKTTEIRKRKQLVTSPKGERFEIEVEYPVEVETTEAAYTRYTKAELGANGLIVVEEGQPAPKPAQKPAHAGNTVASAPAASTNDKAQGRASDREPS